MPTDEHNDSTDTPEGHDAPSVAQPDEEPVGVIPVERIPELQGSRLGFRSPEAREGRSLRSGVKGKQTVRTRYPVSEFHHSVEGVPPITAEGVEVGPSKVDDLLKAAASAGTELEVVD